MKKSLVALAAALSLSNAAFAGDYESAVNNVQNFCNDVGGLAEIVYQWKDKGNPNLFVNGINGLSHQSIREKEVRLYAVEYAYVQASSSKDAHIVAWGHCMDMTN